MFALKQFVKSGFRSLGVHVSTLEAQPFGVNPFFDAAVLCPDASVVFDVGANVGQTVDKVRLVMPRAVIYSFEPVPATFKALVAHTSGYTGVETINCALGDCKGQVKITLSDISGQNTLLTSAKPGVAKDAVPVITVDDFAAERGIQRIDLLKIDTEGYESAVLQGAKGMLSRGAIDLILAECEFARNPTEPHGDFFDIFDRLSAAGMRVAAFYSGGLDGGGWRWGDVLFMRPRERAVTCSPYSRPSAY